MEKMTVTGEMIAELVELIKTLTAIPAPSHEEDKRVRFIVEYLKEQGYAPFVDEAKNVYVEMGTEEEKQGVHLYTAHTDTVFPDTTPISVREEDGKLIGPGVGDDTANACGMLLFLKYLRKYQVTPKHPVAFVFDSCEEGLGNLKGMWAAFRYYEGRLNRHIAFDGSTDHVVHCAVGSKRYELCVKTVGGHSYNAFGRKNAIFQAARMISALYEVQVSDLPGKTTYNVGTIKGGTSVNTIAQEASFLFEYRSDRQQHMEEMKKRVQAALTRALGKEISLMDGASYDIDEETTLTIRVIGERPGMGDVDVTAQEELANYVKQTLMRYTGTEPDFTSGSTDCNIPLSKGIPAVCFGIYLGELQHTREEWIQIDSLEAGMKTMCFILSDEFTF
ncbi:Acetylornithine deacetylase/Succinyl-diaminopimelate desuccinylase [Lachnospiraceae bacterium XBB1006]|nr:Acetylornithine deacetylase/Succinyl-diaminopimelate desuccinylase [Lachnospiraceae bacterium XBB1006]